MKVVINLILLVIILFLGFTLAQNIMGPIRFQAEYDKRKKAVVDRLIENREAQNAFYSITKKYAPDYDTLKHVILNDSFTIISNIGDPDSPDPDKKVIRKITKVSAKDSIVGALGINLDSLPFVPYSKGAKFVVFADTLSYQKKIVNVVEVKTTLLDFMEEFNTDKYKSFDSRFDPEDEAKNQLKFGDRTKPTTSGNWEK